MNDQVGSHRTSVSNQVAKAPFTAEQTDVSQEHGLWAAFAEA